MITKNLKATIDLKVDHVQGSLHAPIMLLEYGDYECPFCREAYEIIQNLKKSFDKQFCFVFRNFPLSEIHPHAERAAKAAEAAALQNKFWKMHDCLFEHQDSLERSDIVNYAEAMSLDLDKFAGDLDSQDVSEKIQKDFLLGLKEGVNGTPTFFINGARFNGSYRILDRVFNEILDA